MRKSHAAPIATAIRNGSGLKPSVLAKLAAIGAITSTVAALLRNGVTAIAATMISASAPIGGSALRRGREPAGDQVGAAGRAQRVAEPGSARRA